MRNFLTFFKWITSFWKRFRKHESLTISNKAENLRFRIEYVEDLPNLISNNSIFIVQDGNEPDLLVFKCPCGCDANIMLNLLKDASPRWNYEIFEEKYINISPSIWKKSGCKSHFFVVRSNIKWV